MIIDSDNYKAAGIETMFFPGGEPHVKVPKFKSSEPIKLFLKLRTWNDVGTAVCLLDVLERRGENVAEVFVPYFPGARQDKMFDMEAPYTVGIVESMLCAGYEISVFDPHSPVLESFSTLKNVYMPADLHSIVVDEEMTGPVVGIIAPDAGAYERADLFRNEFYPQAALIECSKIRNKRTGALSHYEMGALHDDGVYIVVDDICDGGGTFNLLAEAFDKDKYGRESSLDLFVSHGIFSKGLGAISPRYRSITTTDSWCRPQASDRLTILPLLPLITNGDNADA
jgi:ribose-phosphate pyrophosphokinase